jgi:hypothetical protein
MCALLNRPEERDSLLLLGVTRVGAPTTVPNEMMRARDKATPGNSLEKAEAIAI